MHLSSPGSECLGDERPVFQHPGTSVESTAFCFEPGWRNVTGLPPRYARRHPGARMSTGAANTEAEVLDEEVGNCALG